MKIYLLDEEIPDQSGRSRVIGAYSTEQKARENEPQNRRCAIIVFEVDAPVNREPDYSYLG